MEGDMEKISKNVYAETRFEGSNNSFVVTRTGWLWSTRPQGADKRGEMAEIIAQYGQVKYIINNEPHGRSCHRKLFFPGHRYRPRGTRQSILKMSPEEIKERYKQSSLAEYTLLKTSTTAPPMITLTGDLTVYLGDIPLKSCIYRPLTPYHLAVYVPEEKVIFTADILRTKCRCTCSTRNHLNGLSRWKNWLNLTPMLSSWPRRNLHAGLYSGNDWPCPGVDRRCRCFSKKGMTLEETENILLSGTRYPMQPGEEDRAPMLRKANITRLYESWKTGRNNLFIWKAIPRIGI